MGIVMDALNKIIKCTYTHSQAEATRATKSQPYPKWTPIPDIRTRGTKPNSHSQATITMYYMVSGMRIGISYA